MLTIIIKKVLIIGIHPWTTKLVEELAKHNTDVQFDYATSFEVNDVKLSNVNVMLMDLYYNIPAFFAVTPTNITNLIEDANQSAHIGFYFWLKNFLDANITNYDFVVALSAQFQPLTWFQNFKNKKPILCVSESGYSLERDKLFAKQVLIDLGIPTPKCKILDKDSILSNINELAKDGFPVVIKTNVEAGPCSTWVFTKDIESADIKLLLRLVNLKKASKVVPKIYSEEYINGREASVHFLCNGKTWEYMGSARDYKKNYDGDIGPNTTGTGCYSPIRYFTDDVKEKVFSYMDKIMKYLNDNEIYYNGVMYLGIIIDSDNKPYVLEINTRPGSPEFLTILETIDTTNLLENLYRASVGLDLMEIKSNGQSSVAIGLMNKEFPKLTNMPLFDSVKPIIESIPDTVSMYKHHTIFIDQKVYAFITATDSTRENASNKIYNFLNTIETNDYRYRTDIGFLE
jgi:phosphoribosylamine--glycine ligase